MKKTFVLTVLLSLTFAVSAQARRSVVETMIPFTKHITVSADKVCYNASSETFETDFPGGVLKVCQFPAVDSTANYPKQLCLKWKSVYVPAKHLSRSIHWTVNECTSWDHSESNNPKCLAYEQETRTARLTYDVNDYEDADYRGWDPMPREVAYMPCANPQPASAK
jgi:hypothetical protein